MFAPAEYRANKSNTVLGDLEMRKELYDKHGQHITITYNPVGGHKLPFLFKFPRLSSFLDNCLRNPHTDNTVRDYSMEFTTFRKNPMKENYQ